MQDAAPPCRRRPEERQRAEQPVDPHLDHHSRHQGRDVARRGGMRVREPDVHGPEPGLRAESRQGQPEAGRRESGRGRRRAGNGVEVVGAARGQGSRRARRERATPSCEATRYVIPARRTSSRSFSYVTRKIRGERHDLPCDQKEDSVPRDDERPHRGDQEVEEEENGREPPLADVGGEVTAAVHRGESRYDEDADEEERGERVEGDVELSDRQRPCRGDRAAVAAEERHGGGDRAGRAGDDAPGGRRRRAARSERPTSTAAAAVAPRRATEARTSPSTTGLPSRGRRCDPGWRPAAPRCEGVASAPRHEARRRASRASAGDPAPRGSAAGTGPARAGRPSR